MATVNPVGVQPEQIKEPQATKAKEQKTHFICPPLLSAYRKVSETASSAWEYTVQKVTDLKDGALTIIQKVMSFVASFFENVTGWVQEKVGIKEAEKTETKEVAKEETLQLVPKKNVEPEKEAAPAQVVITPPIEDQEMEAEAAPVLEMKTNDRECNGSPVVLTPPAAKRSWYSLW